MELKKMIREEVREYIDSIREEALEDYRVLSEEEAMEYLKVTSRDQMRVYRLRHGLKSLRSRPPSYLLSDLISFLKTRKQ